MEVCGCSWVTQGVTLPRLLLLKEPSDHIVSPPPRQLYVNLSAMDIQCEKKNAYILDSFVTARNRLWERNDNRRARHNSSEVASPRDSSTQKVDVASRPI